MLVYLVGKKYKEKKLKKLMFDSKKRKEKKKK